VDLRTAIISLYKELAKVLFHPLLPYVRKGTAIGKVPKTRPFVLTATNRENVFGVFME
jgi:hypothetical protein